jgi:hypothetical protein
MLKTILWWFSGFAGGCFLGALIACPAKSLSLPVTGVIAVDLGLIAWKIKGTKETKKEEEKTKK